jgi:3-oxoacyl-[acyl-carrier-protein] synthase-1
MPKQVYLHNLSLISPLGKTVDQHLDAFLNGKTGIQLTPDKGFQNTPLPLAFCADIENNRYDYLLKSGLEQAQQQLVALGIEKPSIILSSTKGNLDLLPHDTFASSRQIIAQFFPQSEINIISNACISGVLALQHGAELIQHGYADAIVVIGIDAVSSFVSFGFQSLFALSDTACKPFDAKRNGTTLGEACGIVLLSNTKKPGAVQYLAGASSNDANHISGPSRTGEGLVKSVEKTISRAGVSLHDIDFISAHGTATVYNDEMESIAFDRLGLSSVPLNSMKGYFGHTLGAAGVIETMMSIVSLEKQLLFTNLGFDETGTSKSLNIITSNQEASIQTILKTASGFGGGNASILIQKTS